MSSPAAISGLSICLTIALTFPALSQADDFNYRCEVVQWGKQGPEKTIRRVLTLPGRGLNDFKINDRLTYSVTLDYFDRDYSELLVILMRWSDSGVLNAASRAGSLIYMNGDADSMTCWPVKFDCDISDATRKNLDETFLSPLPGQNRDQLKSVIAADECLKKNMNNQEVDSLISYIDKNYVDITWYHKKGSKVLDEFLKK